MMQGSIIGTVSARNNCSLPGSQEFRDRTRTGTGDALAIEIVFRSEEDGRKPGRQDYRAIDAPSDGQSFPGHNGIDSLFFCNSFCVLSHRFIVQHILHIRFRPGTVFQRYPESKHMVEAGGLKGMISCHFLMLNQKDWRRSMNSFNFFFPFSSISTNSIPAS